MDAVEQKLNRQEAFVRNLETKSDSSHALTNCHLADLEQKLEKLVVPEVRKLLISI